MTDKLFHITVVNRYYLLSYTIVYTILMSFNELIAMNIIQTIHYIQ